MKAVPLSAEEFVIHTEESEAIDGTENEEMGDAEAPALARRPARRSKLKRTGADRRRKKAGGKRHHLTGGSGELADQSAISGCKNGD